MSPRRRRRNGVIPGLVCFWLLAAAAPAQAPIDWSKAQRVEVTTIDNRFVPTRLTLHRDVAYRLHLENHGKELHEFTAPAFFAAATVRDPRLLANGGQEVVLRPGATADIDLIPRRTGHYALTCADHDWEGMIGEIDVD